MTFLALPLWLQVLLIFLALAVLALIFFTIFSFPFFARHLTKDTGHNRVIPIFAGISTGLYSILFGLTTVILWQNFHAIQNNVTKEANSLAIALIHIKVLPKPIQTKLTAAIKQYVLDVRNKEWHHMTDRSCTSQVWRDLWEIFYVAQGYQPETPLQTIYYTKMLTNLEDALDARRERLIAVKGFMPPSLLYVLLFGMVLITMSVALLVVAGGSYLLFMNIVICGFLALGAGVIIDLNEPFKGSFHISDASFSQDILAQFK